MKVGLDPETTDAGAQCVAAAGPLVRITIRARLEGAKAASTRRGAVPEATPRGRAETLPRPPRESVALATVAVGCHTPGS